MRTPANLIAIAAVLFATSSSAQPAAPAASRGQLLYQMHCVECHSTQMHWRDARAASSWPSLLSQVRRWQERAHLQWSEEDIDGVARYLNDTIYHFESQQKRQVGSRRASAEDPT